MSMANMVPSPAPSPGARDNARATSTILHFVHLRSIRTKLLFLVAGVALFMGVVSAIYFSWKTGQLLSEQVVNRGNFIASNLAYNSQYGVLTEDPTTLDQLVEGTTNAGNDVVAVVIRDAKGRVLAQTQK